jgi:hypothetical protein
MNSPVFRWIKNCLIFLLVAVIFWIVIDQTIMQQFKTVYTPGHLNKDDVLRYASPYIEFKGKPNALDHDEFGYLKRFDTKPKSADPLKIAFFGGSTGYLGNPNIAQIIEGNLERQTGKPVLVKNFSVVSSNHRQHLHNILESRSQFQPDIIVFYGGYNETGQTAYYDPRPNYPYSYFFRTDTSPIIQWLLNQSPTFFLIDFVGKRFRLWDLTGLDQLRKSENVFSEAWGKKVVGGYFETLALSKSVTEGFPSNHCGGPAKFIFFYQPYIVPNQLEPVNAEIISNISQLKYGVDLSSTFDKKTKSSYFEDIVHVTPEGNAILGQAVSSAILKDDRLKKCFGSSTIAPQKISSAQ